MRVALLRAGLRGRLPEMVAHVRSGGASLLLFGVGSKRDAARQLAADVAGECAIVEVDGVASDATAAAIERAMAALVSAPPAALPRKPPPVRAPGAGGAGGQAVLFGCVSAAADQAYAPLRLLLLVHSADALHGRDPRATAVLQAAASARGVAVVATADNWRYSVTLDDAAALGGRWLALDATTWQPYSHECAARRVVEAVGRTSRKNVGDVLAALSDNQRFAIDALLTLAGGDGEGGDAEEGGGGGGGDEALPPPSAASSAAVVAALVEEDALYAECRGRMVPAEAVATALREMRDHGLLSYPRAKTLRLEVPLSDLRTALKRLS